ncbi:MAG: hypothetical protein EKK48_07935 [Candidatus Melainabacteria bacterium]|nr:MAG: hypothetical protein EKK48_07935 [Candidatus Melainabacteria bacterium]
MYKTRLNLPAILIGLLITATNNHVYAANVKSIPFHCSGDQRVPMNSGFTYRLPKTLISVKGTFGVYQKITYTDKTKSRTSGSITYMLVLTKPLELSFPNVADYKTQFLIRSKNLQSFTVASIAGFTFSEDGTINTANADFEDKTGEIIKDSAQTAANVGAMIAKAIAGKEVTEIKLVKEFTQDLGPYDPETFAQQNETIITIPIIEDTPADPVRSTFFSAIEEQGDDPNSAAVLKRFSTISLGLHIPKAQPESSNEMMERRNHEYKSENLLANIPLLEILLKQKSFDGLVVRNPRPLKTTVAVTFDAQAYSVFNREVPFAQYGDITILPMRSSLFVHKTHKVAMSKAGGVSSYDFTATSRGATIAKSLADATDSLNKGFDAFAGLFKSPSSKSTATK